MMGGLADTLGTWTAQAGRELCGILGYAGPLAHRVGAPLAVVALPLAQAFAVVRAGPATCFQQLEWVRGAPARCC